MRDGSGWHAIAMSIYALEELAKYFQLLAAKKSATGSTLELDERLFGRERGSHKYKIEIGRKLIPQEAMNIFPKSFDPVYFDPKHFKSEDTFISEALRLETLFVDWKDGKWVHGTPILAERIKNFTDEILNALVKLEGG
jgi:AbiV family abortive infection protein